MLLIIVFCLWIGITEKRLSACAGLISVLVFAFSSYPMQIPGFAIAFYFLLAACVVGSSRLQILFFIIMIALLGVTIGNIISIMLVKNGLGIKCTII